MKGETCHLQSFNHARSLGFFTCFGNTGSICVIAIGPLLKLVSQGTVSRESGGIARVN